MLSGHNLVYFSPGQWDGLWRNRHQLMSVFARQNTVLWVERRPELRSVLAKGLRDGHALDHRRAMLKQVSDNLYVYRYPDWAPISGRTPLKQLTRAIRRKLIQGAMRQLGMLSSQASRAPIVWFSQPRMVDLIGEIPPASLLLYHVVDEYTAYKGVTPDKQERLEKHEQEMMGAVDAVVVVSQKLYEAKSPHNAHTWLIPNGVDYAAYSAALEDPELPPELSGLATPRLGYSGLIGDRLNLNMLKELAEGHPHWSLVFLGQVEVRQQADAWQAMLKLPNVHYLGQVHVSRVPHYLKGFQVGLMPYAVDRQSEHISPLKMYDYMAAALPVASLDIPAAREFSEHVHLASTPAGFAQAVERALADTAPERQRERRQLASRHTWEARVEQLSDLIEARLATLRRAG